MASSGMGIRAVLVQPAVSLIFRRKLFEYQDEIVEISKRPTDMTLPQTRKRTKMVWFVFLLLLAISVANIFALLFALPAFQQIYHDMLGAHPLPLPTSAIIKWKLLFVFLAFLWPAAGITIFWINSTKNPVRYICGLFLLAVLQVGLTTIALFIPLIGDIQRIQPGT
jgi:hypothetical protein